MLPLIRFPPLKKGVISKKRAALAGGPHFSFEISVGYLFRCFACTAVFPAPREMFANITRQKEGSFRKEGGSQLPETQPILRPGIAFRRLCMIQRVLLLFRLLVSHLVTL